MTEQATLFDLYQGEQAPKRKRWGGADSTKARAKCRAMLPAPCLSCGGMITREDPESSWQAGHTIDRVDTEAAGLPHADVLPQHTKCNTSAGGKRGAAMTNQRHQTPAGPVHRDKEPQWW